MTEHEEINKRIHQWLGKCWHEIETSVEKYGGMRTYRAKCNLCHAPHIPEREFVNVEPTSAEFIPDYCTDWNAMGNLMAELAKRDYSLRIVKRPPLATRLDCGVVIYTVTGRFCQENDVAFGRANEQPLAVATAVDNLIKSTEAK